jgi:CRISPR-associated protein Csb1
MLLRELMSAQALRSSVALQPVDGHGGRIFPPTYPFREEQRNGQKFCHVVERVAEGQLRVLVDSVASQANRQEAALVAARTAGRLNFSDVYVDFSGTSTDVTRLSATEMPHRLSDAILRDSEIGGAPFGKSEFGRKILFASPANLTPLIEGSPTSLVFGVWFSQHGLARQFRIQRATTSEIWAENAVLGRAVGSRIDPLGIEKLTLFEAEGGDGSITHFRVRFALAEI